MKVCSRAKSDWAISKRDAPSSAYNIPSTSWHWLLNTGYWIVLIFIHFIATMCISISIQGFPYEKTCALLFKLNKKSLSIWQYLQVNILAHGENILKKEVQALWEVRLMNSCDISCLLVSPEFLPTTPPSDTDGSTVKEGIFGIGFSFNNCTSTHIIPPG